MHDYPNDPAFAFKDATTEQLRDFCEQISGMELDWFFQQWIYEPYYPVYEWGYSHYQQGNQDYLHVAVRQQQTISGYSHLYKMPIDLVLVYTDNTIDTLVIWDSLAVQYFNVPISGTPQTVSFDPGNWILKKATQVPVSQIEPPIDVTSTFNLYQNFPNPFNETTVIPFSLDTSGRVLLEIYDVTGRKVRTLLDSYLTQGAFIHWDGKDDRGLVVASGVYMYQIRFQNKSISRKMFFVR